MNLPERVVRCRHGMLAARHGGRIRIQNPSSGGRFFYRRAALIQT
jgi:hypothetical protein